MKREILVGIIAIVAVIAIVRVIAAGDALQTQQGLSREEAIQMVLDTLEESVILTNYNYYDSCSEKCNSQNKTCVTAHRQFYNWTGYDSWYEPIACSEERTSGQKLCSCTSP